MAKPVELLLAERYADSGWAFFQEVWNTLGLSGNRRRADALAFGLHESKGFELHGHEVKTARNDLLRELADPTKGEAFFQYCDRWWLVVGDRALVDDIMDRIPAKWGVLAPAGNVLRAIKKAPRLKPKPWTRGFIASVMRQTSETHVSRSYLNQVIADQRAREAQMVEQQLESALARKRVDAENKLVAVEAQLASLQAAVREYAAVTGIDLAGGPRGYGYGRGRHAAEVGKLAHFLKEQGGNDMRRLASMLEEATPLVRAAADALGNAADEAARQPHTPDIKDPFCAPPGACADFGREQCDKHAPIPRDERG